MLKLLSGSQCTAGLAGNSKVQKQLILSYDFCFFGFAILESHRWSSRSFSLLQCELEPPKLKMSPLDFFFNCSRNSGAVRPPNSDCYSWPKCLGPVTHGHLYVCREALWARLPGNKPVLGLFPASKCYGRHLTILRSRARILIKNLWALHPRRVQTLHHQHFTNSISAGGWANPVGEQCN